MTDVRLAYRDLDGMVLLGAAERLLRHPADTDAAAMLASEAFGLTAGVARAIATAVLASQGPFARLARAGLDADDPRVGRAAAELDALGAVAHADLEAALTPHGLGGVLPAERDLADAAVPPAHAELLGRMLAGPGWGALAPAIAHHHAMEGTGPLATHRVLRFAAGRLEPVGDPDPMDVHDLVGGEDRREPLRAALAAFAAGGPANDALLYGPPGTGKSATVRALAAAHAHMGVRLVCLDRADAREVRSVFAAVAGRGPRCLLLLDDLVFDDRDRTDRALRAALEGDVAARPENVMVWATTNRLGLVRDTRSNRDDELDESMARGERNALATRFGLRVAFPGLSREEYLRVALGILQAMGGDTGGDAAEAAMRFTRTGHGMTPRTARQFAVARMAGS